MDYTYKKLFKYLIAFNSQHKAKFLLFTLLQLVSSIVSLYDIYAMSQIVAFFSKYTKGDSLEEIYTLILIWFLVIITRNVCSYSARLLSFNAGMRNSLNTQVDAVGHISHIDISWHEKENAGNKVKRIQKGSEGLNTLTRMWVTTVISIIVNFVGTLIIISKVDHTIAWILIAYQIVYFFIASTLRKKANLARHIVNVKDEEFTGLIFETVNNIRSVKVLGMTDAITSFLKEKMSDLRKAMSNRILWIQSGVYLRKLWEGFARVAFVGFIIYQISQGRYELSFLILFYGYFNTINGAVDELANVAQDIAEARSSIGRLGELLELPITIDSTVNKTDFPQDWSTVSFRNLSFTYGGSNALSNIDFEIKRGEKIGIVGLSGAGKSTLFKLLLKEHEASEGDIYIGNTPLKTIQKDSYLKHVAAVLQETEVFNMSLKQNIALANIEEQYNDSLFKKAIDTSHVADFINKLPQGVESIIGEKGIKLSGGEKQRVGIARAIFKDPQILLLDEATSHLDVESEGKIKDSLHQFFQGITAIVIAHRLSTIREMDKIIVIEGGRIIESGNFDELYNKDARFREFWDKQALQ